MLTVLEQSLAVAWPREGCALLLGQRHAQHLQLASVWPCLNVWHPDWPNPVVDDWRVTQQVGEPSRRDRFVVDPRELIAARKHCRERDLQLLGVAHSHPQGACRPSPLDQRYAWDATVMWISALQERSEAGAASAAWWIDRSGDRLQPLVVRILHSP